MANINLTVYDAKRSTNVDFTTNKIAATATDVYFFPNDGNTKLILQSTAGGTATFETPGTEDGLAITDKVITLTGTKLYVVGPWPGPIYNQADGKVKVTFSAATDVLAFRG